MPTDYSQSFHSCSYRQYSWRLSLTGRLAGTARSSSAEGTRVSSLPVPAAHIPLALLQNSPLFLVMAAGHFAAADESCPGHTYTWQYLAKATSPPTPCCKEGLAGNAFSHMPVMSDCAIAGQLPAALSAVFRSAMVFISPLVLTHGECLVGRPSFHTA